mgnify:FL=1
MTNKYCEHEGCKLEAAKDNIDRVLDFQENHDDFIRMAIRDNPEVHPSCIKKYLADILREESARLFVEAVTRRKAN